MYVTEAIDGAAIDVLRRDTEVAVGYGPDARHVEEALPTAHGLVVRRMAITADLLERAPNLRVIARPGVGYENIDVAAATERGIPILLTANANYRSVAELVFALAMAVLRRVPTWDRVCRNGGFAHREAKLGQELSGKRIGLIGVGRVGSEVARIARHGFGMDVLAHHPTRPDEELWARGLRPVRDLHAFLAECDVVSVQVPLTDLTRNLISTTEFACMPSNSILINVARGGIVDEQALVAALREGRLAGAGIDVFEQEPPPFDHPLFGLDNVVVSPHRGGRTVEAVRRMGADAVRGLLAVLAGGPADVLVEGAPVTLVNPDVLERIRS